jgi:hypothetical protein
MNGEREQALLDEVRHIRELLQLLAEPAVAQRDATLRDELRKLVGASARRQKSVLLMNGARTQKDIIAETSVHGGDLSTLVKKLEAAGLLVGDKKKPKLALSIPTSFFDDKP